MKLSEAIRNNCLSDLISMYVDKNKADEMVLQILLKDLIKLRGESHIKEMCYFRNDYGELISSEDYDEETGEWYERDYKKDVEYIQILNDLEKLKILITRINLILNPPTTHTTDTVIDKPIRSMDKPKYTHSELLENYHFWDNVNTKTQGRINIFNNITEQQFFEMIYNADFSMIVNKHGYSKRVRYNIHVLSRILGTEWGERAAEKLKTTLKECGKCSGFNEFSAIKKMYLP